jgi:hypothetical protein
MAGLFDSLGALFAGGAGGSAAPAVGQPLIKALLAKHGMASPGGPAPGGAPMPDAAPAVGSDIASPEARTANVFDNLDMPPGIRDASGGSVKDVLAAPTKPRGFLDRIGDFLHSDEGRATAMRFAAGAFDGGMAGGLKAATGFADERRHERAVTGAADADRAERSREFDATDAFRTGQLDLTRDQNAETARHNQAGEGLEGRRIGADLYKHDTPSGDASLHSSTTRYTHDRPSGDTIVNTGERRFEHITPSGDVVTQQAGETARNDADNRTSILNTLREHPAPHDSIHLHYQATPQTLGAQHRAAVAAVRPSEVQPGDNGETVHHVANDDQYNALPSGARFMGPDGKVRVKP